MTPHLFWVLQRVSSVVFFLTLLPIAWLVTHAHSYNDWMRHASSPIWMVIFLLFMGSATYHLYSGLRVILEDYVSRTRLYQALHAGLIGSCIIFHLWNVVCLLKIYIKAVSL